MEFTATQHWDHFCEFVEYELATGGPDPHARYIGILAFPQGWKEKIWRGGLYSAVYTSPTAEAVYRAWPYERVAQSSQAELLSWLAEHWAGLPLRRERRAVRTPEKLSRCLWSYHAWMDYQLSPLLAHLPPNRNEAYEMLWKAADRALYGFGRYALTKVLDFYERYCDIDISMSDIRPVDGWSPRETLELLYPARAPRIAARYNTPMAIKTSNFTAAEVKNRLRLRSLDLDWFRLEVMLCEYRQSAIELRQYPGRSIDSELKYLLITDFYWSKPGQLWASDIWDVRKAIHPSENLGELNGWDGVRDELGHYLAVSGKTWSDLVWDYNDYRKGPVKEKEGGRKRVYDLAQQALRPGADKQPVPAS